MIYFIAIFSTLCALNFIIALLIRKGFKGDKEGQIWWFINNYTYISLCCCFVSYGSLGTIFQWSFAETVYANSWVPFVIWFVGFYYNAFKMVQKGR